MKQSIFILLLALGIQTQAQIPPPNISNVTFSQEGCLLTVRFDCATCSEADALHIYYFDFISQRWIDIAVMQSSWPAYKNEIKIPLCTADTAGTGTPGLLCTQDGITYRVNTLTNAYNLSGSKAFMSGRTAYSGQFIFPTVTTPSCGGVLPPEPEMATPAKKKGGKK